MKILRILCIIALTLTLAISDAYTGPGGKGKGKGRGRGGGLAKGYEKRAEKIEKIKERPQMNRRDDSREKIVEMKKNIRHMREIREFRENKDAKWSRHPHDERGQGNMGKPDMIAPYGHDKEFAREDVFGNRGRVVRETEPEPVPMPEPIPNPKPQL